MSSHGTRVAQHPLLYSPSSALCPLPSTLCPQLTMDCYELNFAVPSPGNSTVFVEFSPNGRFLAVGDWDSSSLYILNRLAGFHPTISAATPAKPTALVWETSKTLYVGLNDGRFIHYRIDLGNTKLVKGTTNSFFYGGFPTTAIALDMESRTLVMSVGPDVFAFRRVRATSEFHSLTNHGGKLTWVEVNSASSEISRAASISKETLAIRLPHFQDPSVLPPTTHSSSRFAGKT